MSNTNRGWIRVLRKCKQFLLHYRVGTKCHHKRIHKYRSNRTKNRLWNYICTNKYTCKCFWLKKSCCWFQLQTYSDNMTPLKELEISLAEYSKISIILLGGDWLSLPCKPDQDQHNIMLVKHSCDLSHKNLHPTTTTLKQIAL